MTVPVFSTSLATYSRLNKKVQNALSISPLMDSQNLSKMVLDYIYPITKRYLYSIDVSVEFKEEIQRKFRFNEEVYPIDYKLLILASDEIEAAIELERIVKQLDFFEELDFSIENILKYKQRYEDMFDPNIGFIKRGNKPFYTIKPVILYHTESQMSDDEIYRYPSKDKKIRNKNNYWGKLDFPAGWF